LPGFLVDAAAGSVAGVVDRIGDTRRGAQRGFQVLQLQRLRVLGRADPVALAERALQVTRAQSNRLRQFVQARRRIGRVGDQGEGAIEWIDLQVLRHCSHGGYLLTRRLVRGR